MEGPLGRSPMGFSFDDGPAVHFEIPENGNALDLSRMLPIMVMVFSMVKFYNYGMNTPTDRDFIRQP